MTRYLLLFLLFSSAAFGQTFYVEPTGKGFDEKITEKLKYDNFNVTSDSTSYDYKIECLIRQTSKLNSMYKGYIRVTDKAGKEVARSEEVRRGAVAVNGFNAGANIFGVIAEKHLLHIIKEVTK